MAAPDEYGDNNSNSKLDEILNESLCIVSDIIFLPIASFNKFTHSRYYKKLDNFISNLENNGFIIKGDSITDITKIIKKNKKYLKVNDENIEYRLDIIYNLYSNNPIMTIKIETNKWTDDPKEILYTYDKEGNCVNIHDISTFHWLKDYIEEFIQYLGSINENNIINIIQDSLNNL